MFSLRSPLFFSRFRLPLIGGLMGTLLLSGCGWEPEPRGDTREIRWGTSAVGSAGHRALVNLARLLEEEMDSWSITVLPMPGAIMTMREFANGSLDGFYGADIAFYELARKQGRFARAQLGESQPLVQSFWAYSMDMGLAVRERDHAEWSGWRELEGQRLFTGPAPWDTRAHLERVLSALEIDFQYVDIDLSLAGSQLDSGVIDAIGVYTMGGAEVAPWVAEAALGTRMRILNPSPEEQQALEEAGFLTLRPDKTRLRATFGDGEAVFFPFYYGFHLGLDFSATEVLTLLQKIEVRAGDLAAMDPAFAQLARDMPGLQRAAVARSIEDLPVHPGLALYLKSHDLWDPAWDDRIAPTAP